MGGASTTRRSGSSWAGRKLDFSFLIDSEGREGKQARKEKPPSPAKAKVAKWKEGLRRYDGGGGERGQGAQ